MLFWAVMMGLLLHREVIVPRASATVFSHRFEQPEDLWMGVYLAEGAERVGFINVRSTPKQRNGEKGAEMGLAARLKFSLFGRRTELFLTGKAWIAMGQGLSSFDFSLKSGAQRMRIEGAVMEGVLEAQLHTAGETIPFSFPIDEKLMLSGGMAMPSLEMPTLEPGEEVYIDTFDPTTMDVGRAKLTCVGEETLEWDGETVAVSVIETSVGGITTKAWVTDEQDILRAETALGFVLERISPQEAMAPIEPTQKANLIRALAVQPTGPQPWRGVEMLNVRFSGIDDAVLPPSSPVQTRTPAGYVITTPEPPDDEAAGEPLPEEERTKYLASDPFVQSDHPRIRKAAQEAVGEATEAWPRALALYKALYETIEKKSVLSVPSALDVLQSREGDCNEHTVLFVAMARALEIPSRIAIGLTWSDRLEGFGYHAWPEVYVGRWIPMDPTLGQPIADATHIKLLEGSIDQWPQLLPYIGQVQMEIIDVK